MYFFGLMIYHLCLCVPLCGVGNKLLFFKNGENCLGLRELLWEGSPLDVLTGRSYHGQNIFAISSPDLGRLGDFVHTITRKWILKKWESYWSNFFFCRRRPPCLWIPSTCGAVALQLFVSFSCVVWWFCLSFAFWPSLSLCCFCSASSLGGLLPSSLRSVLFSFCHSRVLCLVFLAADWSRISSATLSCSSHSTCSPFPLLVVSLNIGSSVVPLTGQGITSLVLIPPSLFRTKHCLWPQTGPGAVALQHRLMELLTRQQAEQTWFEPDPNAQFDDLLEALGLYKDISTEYGLNQTVHHQWRFGTPQEIGWTGQARLWDQSSEWHWGCTGTQLA